MGCRRKTKSERELIADIKKTFERYCESVGECRNCVVRLRIVYRFIF